VSERWIATPLSEIAGYADEGRPRWHMIRSTLGIMGFGANAWTSTGDDQELIGAHDELGQGAGGHEELYVVLAGSARFRLDDAELDATAGTVVFVRDPAVRRSATGDPGTTVLVIGGKPDAPFTVSPWERSAEALRFWQTEEWDRAIAVLERQHIENPTDGGVLYNLACAEARAGRRDDAIDHLRLSVSLEPRFAANAPSDPDLASLHDDPRFPVR
jgi:tetratricopeptide (TPR) repeat protein